MSDNTSQTVSYVRKEMLPEQAPPATQRGVVKWIRENLFSSWLNIILTVLSLYVVYLVLAMVLPWAFGGVWNAGSLTECREALFSVYKTEAYGSHGAACWAVIEDRWLQLLFGFYPSDLYWRPILAFVLFFVAIAPVLFADKVPSQMLWFTAAFPFIATWLIWGGSFWTPIFVALGFVFAVVAYKVVGKLAGPIVANLAAIVAAIVWWAVLMGPIDDGLHKTIGAGRLDSTTASLETRAEELPALIEASEAASEAQQAVILDAVAEKDAILNEMREIRVAEFPIVEQIEVKEVALRLLDGVTDTLDKITDLKDDWGGVPLAGDGADEAEIAEADEALADLEGYVADISKFLTDAQADIEGDALENATLAEDVLAAAGAEDSSILGDVNDMIDRDDLAAPLVALVARAEAFDITATSDDIADLKAEVETASAGLAANIASLEEILGKVVQTNAADLAEPQARFNAKMAELTGLRDTASLMSQETFRLTSEENDGRRLLAELNGLGDNEARLPELQAEVAALGADLTRAERGMIAVTQLPDDAPEEKIETLEAYLDARNSAANLAASIDDTYATVGRVGLEPVVSRQIGGFMLALIIGIAGIVLSLPLGILLALGRQSHLFIINKVCVTFIEVIRGVPLIVWLFTASILLNYFLPPGTNFDLMLRVIIMVTLFASAYIAEVIRGGLAALPTGQYEGADSLGLSYWQSMQLIVLPQALKISIPGIVNTFIGLFKDTTLVVLIGLLDPLGFSNLIRADTDWNGVYWELFVFIALMFFIFCFSMGRYSLFLEKKLQREHR